MLFSSIQLCPTFTLILYSYSPAGLLFDILHVFVPSSFVSLAATVIVFPSVSVNLVFPTSPVVITIISAASPSSASPS